MTKAEFEKLSKEQMIVAYNQLKDDYSSLFDELEQEKEKNNNLIKQLQEQNTEIQDISRQLRQEKEKNELFVLSGNSINLERHIKNNYISKDKIFEFIKEETREGTYNFKSISAKRLKELLEEK